MSGVKVVSPLPSSVWVPTLANARALDQAYGTYFGSYEVFEDALARFHTWAHKPDCVDYWKREIDGLACRLYDMSPWDRAGFISTYLVHLITR